MKQHASLEVYLFEHRNRERTIREIGCHIPALSTDLSVSLDLSLDDVPYGSRSYKTTDFWSPTLSSVDRQRMEGMVGSRMYIEYQLY